MDLINTQQINQQQAIQFRKAARNKGVCYLSRIPPYMTPNHIRRLLKDYEVERIYLLAEDKSQTQHRKKIGGNKKQKYTEGWVEFSDKAIAKLAALTLNGQAMASNKGSFYANDTWTIKYLPKFKWEHLTAKLAYEQRMKKQRLKLQDSKAEKIQDFYATKSLQSKIVNQTINTKLGKGIPIEDSRFVGYNQQRMLEQEDR